MGSLDDDEDEEDESDLERNTKRVDDLWDDITTLGQGVPIYETTLRDRRGREYTGKGDSEEDSYQNALQEYRSSR